MQQRNQEYIYICFKFEFEIYKKEQSRELMVFFFTL